MSEPENSRAIGTCPGCGLLLGYDPSHLHYPTCPGCLRKVKFGSSISPSMTWRDYLVVLWRRVA